MAYGIYLKMDQDRAHRDDFSSDAFLTGTVYTDIVQATAKNLTGYTVTVRMPPVRRSLRHSQADNHGDTREHVIE